MLWGCRRIAYRHCCFFSLVYFRVGISIGNRTINYILSWQTWWLAIPRDLVSPVCASLDASPGAPLNDAEELQGTACASPQEALAVPGARSYFYLCSREFIWESVSPAPPDSCVSAVRPAGVRKTIVALSGAAVTLAVQGSLGMPLSITQLTSSSFIWAWALLESRPCL